MIASTHFYSFSARLSLYVVQERERADIHERRKQECNQQMRNGRMK